MPHLFATNTGSQNLESWKFIVQSARDLGFFAAGVSPARPVPAAAAEAYRGWLEGSCPDALSYLTRHLPQRFDPRHHGIVPDATAVVVVAAGYAEGSTTRGLFRHVAAHARGRDYHLTLKERLLELAGQISKRFPGCRSRVFVDSAPLLERTWAVLCGIGSIGRNGCLIVPDLGCRAVLGEIVCAGTPVPTPPPLEPHFSRCGECTRCVEACPTGALGSDGLVDAARCLSCWTIENRDEELPPEIASRMELVFGCDRCTAVCPLNDQDARSSLEPPPNGGPDHLELAAIARPAGLDLEEVIAGTALERTGATTIARNARALLRARAGKG